jgi:hypothetical protein
MKSSWNSIKNKHKGETGIVIGNGPSLSDVPLEFLGFYPSFGTNRIYLLDGFTPDYYVAVTDLVIQQFNDEIRKLECRKFIKEIYTRHLIEDAYPLNSSVTPGFSREPDKWIYEGYTVTYVCLQLAFYMGFETILLVGVDHKFKFEGEPNEVVRSTGADVNHFHKDYFGRGIRWYNPDLYRSMQAYRMANLVFENAGRKIMNLTPGSALDVFEKGDIAEW